MRLPEQEGKFPLDCGKFPLDCGKGPLLHQGPSNPAHIYRTAYGPLLWSPARSAERACSEADGHPGWSPWLSWFTVTTSDDKLALEPEYLQWLWVLKPG